jgi:hypothetical protein
LSSEESGESVSCRSPLGGSWWDGIKFNQESSALPRRYGGQVNFIWLHNYLPQKTSVILRSAAIRFNQTLWLEDSSAATCCVHAEADTAIVIARLSS